MPLSGPSKIWEARFDGLVGFAPQSDEQKDQSMVRHGKGFLVGHIEIDADF